jgi:ferredoxin
MCGPCCPGKPATKRLKVAGQEIGIAGFEEIMAKGLEHIEGTDAEQRRVILEELKAHNYVPDGAEKDYMNAVWAEFRQVRARKLGQLEEKYHGIPREEIPWHPSVDEEKCTGCGACAEFCQKGVYVLKDKVVVTNPYRCVVSCTGCQSKCPEGAISFPTFIELRGIMKALRKKYGLLTE